MPPVMLLIVLLSTTLALLVHEQHLSTHSGVDAYLIVDVQGPVAPSSLLSGVPGFLGGFYGGKKNHEDLSGAKKRREFQNNGESCFHHELTYAVGDGSPIKTASLLVNYHVHQSRGNNNEGDGVRPSGALLERNQEEGRDGGRLVMMIKQAVPGGSFVPLGSVYPLHLGAHEVHEVPVETRGPFRICLLNQKSGTQRVSLTVEDSHEHDEREYGHLVAEAVFDHSSSQSKKLGGPAAEGPEEEFIEHVTEYWKKTQLPSRVYGVTARNQEWEAERNSFNGSVQSTYNRVLFFTFFNLALAAGGITLQTLHIKAVLKEKKVV